jgi:hypothetical protein
LDAYRVQGTTKDEFVTNAIHIEMQCCHLYIARHVTRATNMTIVYQAKNNIVDNDMI